MQQKAKHSVNKLHFIFQSLHFSETSKSVEKLLVLPLHFINFYKKTSFALLFLAHAEIKDRVLF
jgi:hypothetical protein